MTNVIQSLRHGHLPEAADWRPRPHPKPQGRPFDIIKPNQLWQTDMTAIWCGEDGWAYLTLVMDCFCRSILGWSFTLRCRGPRLQPSPGDGLVHRLS